MYGTGDILCHDQQFIPRSYYSQFGDDVLAGYFDFVAVPRWGADYATCFVLSRLYIDYSRQFSHTDWAVDVPNH